MGNPKEEEKEGQVSAAFQAFLLKFTFTENLAEAEEIKSINDLVDLCDMDKFTLLSHLEKQGFPFRIVGNSQLFALKLRIGNVY